MFKLLCPACGGEVVFKSKASIFVVCTYCKSSLLRQDLNLELYGKMAELQEDLTPFQIGTKGYWSKNPFELLGRLRMSWDSGYWNEWYVLFGDGQEGWLAEAQGFYSICLEDKDSPIPDRDDIKVGARFDFKDSNNSLLDFLNKGEYEVCDIKKVICIGSEGELPFKAPTGRKSTSIDLNSNDGKFACIEYHEDGNRLFVGEYIEFDDFGFTNLRDIEGW